MVQVILKRERLLCKYRGP